jgi:very-short-patch-repair endonuclease/endogenous inhibitor of DNA gyrase (YacG/DUF329 family)
MINQYKIRTIICKGCGKEITKRMSKGRKYCSIECYRKSKRPQRKTGKIIKCAWCGKEVYKQNVFLSKSKVLFCSINCANKYQGRNKLKFICKMCGKEFYWSKSRIKNKKPIYCSLKCRDKDPKRKEMLRNLNILQQNMKPNNLEKKGYKIIGDLGLKYKQQVLIGNKFLVDAFISKYNLIIQFDGDYWHGNPKKYKIFSDRQKRRRIIDKSQNAYFKKCGFNLLRIWESEINNLKEVLQNDYIKRKI